MRFLDKLFDTYQKRVLVVYVFIVAFLLFFQYHNASLSYALYQVQDINSLYSLLDVSSIYETIIGRLLVGYLNFVNTSGGILKVILYAFDSKHILLFVLIIAFSFHGIKDLLFIRAKWHIFFTLALQWFSIAVVFALALVAMSSGTALIAIQWIHRAAIFYGIVQIILVILHLYIVFDTFYSLTIE